MNLSVCILAYNEEKNIERCLESIKDIADEIVVGVDDRTTDRTIEIVKKYTSNVFEIKHVEYFDGMKQLVIDKAKGKWIFWLDADEEVRKKLKEEIIQIIESFSENDGDYVYKIPRKNIIFGKWIEHTGWYPDFQIRFWKKGVVCFSNAIHQDPEINGGEIIKMENALHHYNYVSTSQYISKLNTYTDLDAKYFVKEFDKPYFKHFLVRPIDEFISRFLKDQGYKDGLHGLTLSILQAFYMFVVVVKSWEMKKFEEEKIGVAEVEEQGKYLAKVWRWWKYENQLKAQSSKIKTVLIKVKRKIS